MSDQQLMPEDLANNFKYDEKWEVYMSNQKEAYILNEMEYAVLQDALLKGIKGVIHFDKFMLNTSFIVSSYRRERKIKPAFAPKQLEEPAYREPTPEEAERRSKMIEEMKAKLHIKLSAS